MHLRDLGLKPGQRVMLSVRAVDGAGNAGKPAQLQFSVSANTPPPLPGTPPTVQAAGGGTLPRLNQAQVAVLDPLDKMNPVTGALIPAQPKGYLSANHLWNASAKQIRLFAARNEFVAFQVAVRGPVRALTLSLAVAGIDESGIALSELRTVTTAKGPLPDPVAPLTGAIDVADGRRRSVLCEVYVPHDAAPGDHAGTLRLSAGGQTLELAVTLHVWDFTLPDFLSFLPEMNCYGLPQNERGYYRLAHVHRTVLNRLPYSQNGALHRGCTPEVKGGKVDWTKWDARFGPYLDGRRLPTCRGRASRWNASTCRSTRTGRRPWKATTTATTGPTAPSRRHTGRRS